MNSTLLRRFLVTTDSPAPALLRVPLAAVMFAHGAQKAFGWFGGFGFDGTMGYFTDTLGMPYALGLGTILIEVLGSPALAAGFLTRAWAVGIVAIMVGAVTVGGHLDNGFFMNWSGSQAGEGVELHLLVVSIAVTLLLLGGGRASVDLALARRRPRG
ncbi:MAG: DoxX family protein [Gemmatimonadota bacterium]